MNILFLPKSCMSYIEQNQSCKELIQLVNTHLTDNFIINDMSIINTKAEEVFSYLESITMDDNRLFYLVNHISDMQESVLVSLLKTVTNIEEKFIILFRLCEGNYDKYKDDMNALLKMVSDNETMKNDPFFVYHIIEYYMMGPMNFDKIKDVTETINQHYSKHALLATQITTKQLSLRTRVVEESKYDELKEVFDTYLNDVASVNNLDLPLLKCSLFYINFLAFNKDLEGLRESISYINTHKTEVISYNSMGNVNDCISLLILLNRIKAILLPDMELVTDVWNETELRLINAENMIDELPQSPIYTDDEKLYSDLYFWYTMFLCA